MASPIPESTQPPVNPFAAHQSVLRERLNTLLATLHPLLHPDVVRALEGEGKLLAQSSESHASSLVVPSGSWPLLTLLVAENISPDINPLYVGSIAIAVECLVCAIDLLDDIID